MGRNYAVAELNDISTESIEKALAILLKNKRFNEISVSEICQKAGVSRNAYYRNFDSKSDVLQAYLDSTAAEFFSSADKSNYEAYYLNLFEHIEKYREFILLLHRDNLDYMLYNIFQKNSFNPIDGPETEKTESVFSAGGVFFVLMEWIIDRKNRTSAEMAEKVFLIKRKIVSNM